MKASITFLLWLGLVSTVWGTSLTTYPFVEKALIPAKNESFTAFCIYHDPGIRIIYLGPNHAIYPNCAIKIKGKTHTQAIIHPLLDLAIIELPDFTNESVPVVDLSSKQPEIGEQAYIAAYRAGSNVPELALALRSYPSFYKNVLLHNYTSLLSGGGVSGAPVFTTAKDRKILAHAVIIEQDDITYQPLAQPFTTEILSWIYGTIDTLPNSAFTPNIRTDHKHYILGKNFRFVSGDELLKWAKLWNVSFSEVDHGAAYLISQKTMEIARGVAASVKLVNGVSCRDITSIALLLSKAPVGGIIVTLADGQHFKFDH